MKILFLDFDGVLCTANSATYYFEQHYENFGDQFGELFDLDCVENLRHLIEQTEAKIVISSSWRYELGWERLQQMWQERKLPGELVGMTPIIHNACRGQEVKQWLENNGWPKEEKDPLLEKTLRDLSPIKNYVIVDDERGFLIEQINHFVRTQFQDGLSAEVTQQCIRCLNKKEAK
jgi:hypothetical protein